MSRAAVSWLWPSLLFVALQSTCIGAGANSSGPAETPHATVVADVPVLISVPERITKRTPLIIMYHGFGPPNSPAALAKVLPPIHDALTVYASLPLLGERMPPGGVDELLRRQNEDYIGQLFYPAIRGAAGELPQIIKSLTATYGLAESSPVILFGFSAGGAAALLSLSESGVRPRAILVVNSPLSITQAVDGYERQSKRAYEWTEAAKDAAAHYDVEKNAARIAQLNPKAAVLIMQSDHDAGLSVTAAQSAAAALKSAAARYNAKPDISAVILPGAGHYVLEAPDSATVEPSGPAVNLKIIDWITRQAFADTNPAFKND